MLLLTMLGLFGLLLTLVGIFSMTAYAVARRKREIGVRVAVGARPTQVVAVMIRRCGVAGDRLASPQVWPAPTTPRASSRSFLFQTDPHDPATLVAVVALLGTAACLAAWLPARRAASIDPVVALRDGLTCSAAQGAPDRTARTINGFLPRLREAVRGPARDDGKAAVGDWTSRSPSLSVPSPATT